MNTKPSILIVDDDPDFRKTLSRILEARGYVPIAVDTEKVALKRVKEERPAVALIDIHLRTMTGLELMGQIKACCPVTECIIITGHASQATAIEAIELGAYSYLQKPCDMEQLILTIRQAIEKREAMWALRESRDRFQQVVVSISDHIYVTEIMADGKRKNIFISPHVEALTGYPQSNFLSDWRFWPSTVIHPDDQSEAAGQVNLLTKGRNSEAEYRLVRADGEIIWVRDSARVQKQGTSGIIYGVVSDITEYKQAEALLRESEAKYRSLFENMTNGFAYHRIVVNEKEQPVDYIFLEINDAFGNLTGLKKDIVGKRVTEVLPGIENDDWIGIYGKVALTGEGLKFEQYSESLKRWYSVSTYSPQKYYFVAIFEDITEQKRVKDAIYQLNEDLEQRVADRTRELSALYEVTAAGSEFQDLDVLLKRVLARTLIAVESNAGFIHLLDGSGETLKLTAHQGMPPDVVALINVVFSDSVMTKRIFEHSEPLIIPDVEAAPKAPPGTRSLGWYTYVAARMRTGGQTIGILSILGEKKQQFNIEQVTLLASIADQIAGEVENARLRQQAKDAAVTEERGRLARELHDSATQSLYSLTLFAEAGRELVETADRSVLKHNFERMGETAQHALKEMRMLVHQLGPLDLQNMGLAGALRYRLNAVEERVNIKARLVIGDPVDLPALTEEGLYRIAQEALNNVLKHAEATTVTVSLHSDDNVLVLEVVDDGIGFDFEAAKDGGGMGLAGMQARVEKLRGTLTIRSEPGKGTSVNVAVSLLK